MAAAAKQKKRAEESRLRRLARIFVERGIVVRREKLSRGSAFRVKSGNCLLVGKDHIFVDKRLPAAQQASLLVDYLVDLGMDLSDQELRILSSRERALLSGDEG